MLNERKLTKSELDKREDIILNMKGNKRDLVRQYGADAEKVMYGRATNMAKKQSESMEQKNAKLREMVKDALKNPKPTTNKLVAENVNPELDRFVNGFVKKLADRYDYSLQDAVHAVMGVLRSQNYDGLNEGESELVKYNGEDHEIVRREGDRIYIRRNDPSAMLGKLDAFWVKQDDLNEITPAQQKYVDKAANRPSKPKKSQFRKEIEGAKRMIDAGKSRDEVVKKYGEDAFNAVNAENEYLEEDYKPSLRAYNVIDAERNVIYSELSREDAIKKSNEKEEYKFIATDNLAEDLDLGHEDNEPHMLKADLYRIGKYAMELYNIVDGFEGEGEVDFPSWWQAKITNAKTAVVGAKHYLDFEMNEPKIDVAVDAIDSMSIDDDVIDIDIEEVEILTPNIQGDKAVDSESASPAYESISRGLAKKLKEGLPKGYWDKNIDAEDEDQDGKIDENIDSSNYKDDFMWADYSDIGQFSMDSEVWDKFKEYDFYLKGKDIVKKQFDGSIKKAYDAIVKSRKGMDESYATVVNKIKKTGKSEKAAKAIAGAVASYKAKGGGKGPTAKQK